MAQVILFWWLVVKVPSETASSLVKHNRAANCLVLGTEWLPSHTAGSEAAGTVLVSAIVAAHLRSYANCEHCLLYLLSVRAIHGFDLNWRAERGRYHFSFLAESERIPLWVQYCGGGCRQGSFETCLSYYGSSELSVGVCLFLMVIMVASLVPWHSKNLCMFLWIGLFWTLKDHKLTKWNKMVTLHVCASGAFGAKFLK